MASSLSTQTISDYIASYKQTEVTSRVTPVQKRVDKYTQLSSSFTQLKSLLTSLNDIASDLKVTTSSSLFNKRSAESSGEDFITATAQKNASVSSYVVRVNQLARSDLAVSNTMVTDTAVTTMAGTHTIQIKSGEFTSNVDVALTGSETNESVMEAISEAINSDYAEVGSSTKTSTDTFTGSGSFTIVMGTDDDGSTPTETTIEYDYTGMTYDAVIEDLVDKINGNVDGVVAEKEVNGSDVGLKITVEDKDKYISIQSSGDTGTLLSDLGIDVTKEKAASALATASVFDPTTGNSKFSISADETGYDKRLIMSDVSGSALSFLGLDSTILTDRTVTSGDNDAGFIYSTTSATDNELNSKLEFNGINIQRNSNTIDDLVDNVTFELKSIMGAEDSDATIKVDIDAEEIRSNIEDFIAKFNEAYTYIVAQSATGSTDSRGVFSGDTTTQTIKSILTNTVIGKVAGLSEDNYNYLSQIGISFDPGIGLTVSDSSELEDAILNNPDQIADLFNSENGIATTLYSKLDGYIGVSGSLATMSEAYDNNINYLNDKIDSINDSIDIQAEILRQKFLKMQEQLTALTNSLNMFSSSSSEGFF
ncbi:MAG: flagellar filament capping protein FliD [Ignavibacteria bacterium]|jgi:flagellar hook-associated protein 2